jgi:hypothetical protein
MTSKTDKKSKQFEEATKDMIPSRPLNAFLMYRQTVFKKVKDENP